MLEARGIPHVILKAPVAVRCYPHELYYRLRVMDFLRPDVFTEEFRVNLVWYQDWDVVRAMLNGWDFRYTLFFYYASERYECLAESFDNPLDAMSSWMSLDKIALRIKIFDETDEQWNERAQNYLSNNKGMTEQERYDHLPWRTKDVIWRSQVW